MCSPDSGTFKIKTEPLDCVDCLFEAPPVPVEFDCDSFMSSTSTTFPKTTFDAPDYFTSIKVENLLDDENFPLLQQPKEERTDVSQHICDAVKVKSEPQDVIEGQNSSTADESTGVVPTLGSFSGMVSIPNEILVPETEIKTERQAVDDRTLVCSVCNAEYTNVKDFVKHHRLHEVKADKKLTQKLTVTPEKSSKQQKVNQKPKERKCRNCELEFPTFNELVNHFLTHYNLSLPSPYQNANHVQQPRAVTKSKRKLPVPQSSSPEQLPMKQLKTESQQSHTTPPPPTQDDASPPRRKRHICNVCGEEFPTMSPLVTHFLTHQNLKLKQKAPVPQVFTCTQCPYQCTSMSRLKQHQDTHAQGLPPVVCATCSKTFRTQKLLDQHVSRQHVKIECKECGQVFVKRNDMVEHYLKHFDLSLKRPKG